MANPSVTIEFCSNGGDIIMKNDGGCVAGIVFVDSTNDLLTINVSHSVNSGSFSHVANDVHVSAIGCFKGVAENVFSIGESCLFCNCSEQNNNISTDGIFCYAKNNCSSIRYIQVYHLLTSNQDNRYHNEY